MKAPTIYEIAAHNTRSGGYYFSKGTLGFFGQRLRDFRVRRLADGRLVVYSRAHRGWQIGAWSRGIVSLAVYNSDTGALESPGSSEERDAIVRQIPPRKET
jgi:hypothetical protein